MEICEIFHNQVAEQNVCKKNLGSGRNFFEISAVDCPNILQCKCVRPTRIAFNNAQGVSMFIEKQEEDVSTFLLLVLIKIAGRGYFSCKEMEREREREGKGERLKLSKMEITIIKMER